MFTLSFYFSQNTQSLQKKASLLSPQYSPPALTLHSRWWPVWLPRRFRRPSLTQAAPTEPSSLLLPFPSSTGVTAHVCLPFPGHQCPCLVSTHSRSVLLLRGTLRSFQSLGPAALPSGALPAGRCLSPRPTGTPHPLSRQRILPPFHVFSAFTHLHLQRIF